MTPDQSPLGKPATYTEQYDATLLFPIARSNAREQIGITARLPFFGTDIWNAYELSWLNTRGKPQIAVATFYVPADSPNIVESKSFKLYLGSFAQTQFDSIDVVRDTIRRDVSASCGATVSVHLSGPAEFGKLGLEEFDGLSLDRLDLDTDIYLPDASLLKAAHGEAPVEETLYSNLLKSNCPVTGQPDWGSVQIHYVGPQIDQAALLRYIISYRNHTGFHEQCVEKMFVDLLAACQPMKLAIYARRSADTERLELLHRVDVRRPRQRCSDDHVADRRRCCADRIGEHRARVVSATLRSHLPSNSDRGNGFNG